MSTKKGSRVKPLKKSIRQEVALDTPQKPAHIKEGFKLILKDLPKYKEPITSPKMQKNLRILDLRIDPEGFLYSPKAYDPEWTWQSQAIWLRTVGIRPIAISKRLNKKLNTVKRMFERVNKLTPFYRGVSNNDWANIGNTWVGTEGSQRVRTINFGGVADQNRPFGEDVFQGDINEMSDMRGSIGYVDDQVIIDQRSGDIYEKVGTTSGDMHNRFNSKSQPETTPFNLKKHNKHHQSPTDPVKALEQTVISFDAYNEQEKQLEAFEKRREANHNKGKHTPRSKHPQKKVAAGHGLTSDTIPHTGKTFGRKRVSIEEKVRELSNWTDYGGN